MTTKQKFISATAAALLAVLAVSYEVVVEYLTAIVNSTETISTE
jgi:hypothetical protein